MDQKGLLGGLKNVIGDFLKAQGINLVDVSLRRQGADFAVKILADKPEGGIKLDECACLNIDISRVIDSCGLLKEGYNLEVSSPGMERFLATKDDFVRCIGRSVRFFLREPVNGRLELEGIINRAEDGAVYIEVKGVIFEVALSKITKARQLVKRI